MKQIRLNVDDRIYYRIKNNGWSWAEVIALGIRAKQLLDAYSAYRYNHPEKDLNSNKPI